MQIGIQPDILVCRTERPLSEELKRKIAQFCNVDFGCVVESPDVKSIYEIPLKLHEQGLDKEVCTRLHLDTKEPDLRAWAAMVEKNPQAATAGTDRRGGQVHGARRQLQEHSRGAGAWRNRQ